MAKKKLTRKPIVRTPPRRLVDGLDQANTLMRRERWPQARDVLVELAGAYPRDPDVLSGLVNVSRGLNDSLAYQSAAERLLAVAPGDHDLRPALAAAYLQNGLPTLAWRTLREFLRLAPGHPKAAGARALTVDLERGLPLLLAELGVEGPDGLKLAELHEQVQSQLNQAEFARARQTAHSALRLKPDLAPVLNNLTEACIADGYLDEALAATERVLAFAPDNIHALANQARVLARLGRLEAGRAVARRLLESTAPAVSGWMKKAEALSYLGLDAEVLAVWAAARQAAEAEGGPPTALLWHLAAVAALNLGQEQDARAWWQAALLQQPGLTLAQANLKDLQKPVGQRNGPWAFDLRYWLSAQAVRDLGRELRAGRPTEAGTGPARRALRKHPELAALTPVWLERGAPDARDFALMLVEAAATPELLSAAKDFALGQRGSDTQRMKAAQLAVKQGTLPPGPVRFWSEGEWRDVFLMGLELHGDRVRNGQHPPRVEQLLQQALDDMQAGRMAEAETLLKQALRLAPDAPDLLNNLASTYAADGRMAEAEATWRALFEREPDYVFARTSLARVAAQRGEVAEARALIEPLLTRRRMHFSEFASLASAQIETALADDKPEEARGWLKMWAEALPDDPRVEGFRHEIARRGGGRGGIKA